MQWSADACDMSANTFYTTRWILVVAVHVCCDAGACAVGVCNANAIGFVRKGRLLA